MMRTYTYRAILEAGDDPNVLVVTFPDVPEAITEGTGETEAREMAEDALGVALLGYAQVKRPLPAPTARTGIEITVTPEVAAKLAVIEAFGAAGISKSELGRRIGRDEKEVRRILDPRHPTRLSLLSATLGAMGKRLVVGVAEAA